MTSPDGYDHGTHRSQYDGSTLANQNCTPTSGANGAREVSEGKVDKSGAGIRSLVARDEETNPNTPGWSLDDLSLAMSRLDVAYDNIEGPFDLAVDYVIEGYAVALQGDSDQFPNTSCSGRFDGAHCITLHPDVGNSRTRILTADPICPSRRWESGAILRNYAEKFGGTLIRFGVFGGEPMSFQFNLERWSIPKGWEWYETPNGRVIGRQPTSSVQTTLGPRLSQSDSDGIDYSWRMLLVQTGVVTGNLAWKTVWIRRPVGNPISTTGKWDASALNVLTDPTAVYPVPPVPSDCAEEIEAAITDYRARVIDSLPPQ